MQDLQEIKPGHNQPEFSVSEISYALKSTVEQIFGNIKVRGEISGFKRHTSGHVYFSLKDENSVINAVIWRGGAKINFEAQDGVEVVCSGRISTYPGRSQYQMIVEKIELAGAGALMQLLEKLKEKLKAEGLFDEKRKRAIPKFPTCIGVITSPTGAVIRDILHRIKERFPLQVILWPVAVQGEGAKEQIAEAIKGFNDLPENITKPDIIIVARGGGSIEDLWAFNEEIVVRSAANSKIPLISAVGHETDVTLIDFVSDKRAPTPTAAAEIATPVKAELISYLLDSEKRMFSAATRYLSEKNNELKAAKSALISPAKMVENLAQRLDDFSERLVLSMPKLIRQKLDKFKSLDSDSRLLLAVKILFEKKTSKLSNFSGLLESLNFKKVLERGFAIVRDASGKTIKTAAAANNEDVLDIQFSDGNVKTSMEGRTGKKPAKKPSGKNDSQGDLF